MPDVIVSEPKTWNGEPAALKGLATSVVLTLSMIYTGQVTSLDGGNAIAAAVAAFVIPLIQGYWTRRSVTPVAASSVQNQVDAK